MDKIIDVAAYIVAKYKEMTHETLDEMKLHKLLYFTQRESFAILGKPAFEGDFEGWKYGPVSREVRQDYEQGEFLVETKKISDDIKYIVNNVLLEYGALASWKLSDLSHREISWLNSRAGLKDGENGSNIIQLADIQKDSEKVRSYDPVWDMYYDEFEDLDTVEQVGTTELIKYLYYEGSFVDEKCTSDVTPENYVTLGTIWQLVDDRNLDCSLS